MKKFMVMAAAALTAVAAMGQVTLVKNHRPAGRIIYQEAADSAAAVLAQDFIQRISGARTPIVAGDTKPRKGDIVISRTDNPAIKEDGFRLSTSCRRCFHEISRPQKHNAELRTVRLQFCDNNEVR